MSAAVEPPRYREIADYLRELIANSPPDGRLPSDAELCERFEVSRMTARNAVQLLAAEGLLYRRRGQGTFVASRPVPRLLGSPMSFTESMRRRGHEASSRILESDLAVPTPIEAEALGLDDGQKAVFLERLRFADGTPMAIERVVLVPDLAHLLDEDLTTGSLHSAMERAGRAPARSRAQVSARLSTPRERELLETSGDGVLLCERRVISDAERRPIERTETRYVAERYSFELVEHWNGSERY